jgi:hypothetical protein
MFRIEIHPEKKAIENINSLASSIANLRTNARHLDLAFDYQNYSKFIHESQTQKYSKSSDAIPDLYGKTIFDRTYNILHSILSSQETSITTNFGIIEPLLTTWRDAVKYLKNENQLESFLNQRCHTGSLNRTQNTCLELLSSPSLSEVSHFYLEILNQTSENIDAYFNSILYQCREIEKRDMPKVQSTMSAFAAFSYEFIPSNS